MEPVDKRTLLKRVRRAEVIVLDVRPPEDIARGTFLERYQCHSRN